MENEIKIPLKDAILICNRLEIDASWDKVGQAYYNLRKQIDDIMEIKKAKKYIKKTGKFPPGRTRCMDCRCSGNGECPGETIKYQNAWHEMMERGDR